MVEPQSPSSDGSGLWPAPTPEANVVLPVDFSTSLGELLDADGSAVVVLDDQRRVRSANDSALALLGAGTLADLTPHSRAHNVLESLLDHLTRQLGDARRAGPAADARLAPGGGESAGALGPPKGDGPVALRRPAPGAPSLVAERPPHAPGASGGADTEGRSAPGSDCAECGDATEGSGSSTSPAATAAAQPPAAPAAAAAHLVVRCRLSAA